MFLTLAIAPVIIPTVARAQCGISYIVLPSNECLSLDYLPTMAASRSNVTNAKLQYQRQLEANITLDLDEAYRTSETAAERQERYVQLYQTKRLTEELELSGKIIEEWGYILHQKNMGRVSPASRRSR
ncbi:MAG TPA: hypothetical protein IGS53_05505 [Leptolyngbyaceae cyanobacterium M33_DOE_097]|uniref:Uncharacterized protein n=1 Tax=Oscillatoriales cyanobacterium SpSt-418 TaxID=2282169 RepID=A0A7C3KBP8_9CYAN|nr:hypothetical protein [Leptolyngbyaceae cyanobacterium M33_DOE_097]